MTTVNPLNMVKALDEFYAADKSSLFNDGIEGDAAHRAEAEETGTYHMSAQDCGYKYGHLYSLERAEDIAGGKANPGYASAHDIGGNQTDRITVTKRVLAAFYAKDPRLVGVAEFAGTTNGTSVHACYPNTWTDDPHNNGGWNAGHYENHCHVSFKRDHCNDYASIKAFMSIVAGLPAEQGDWLDMATLAEVEALIKKHTDPILAAVANDLTREVNAINGQTSKMVHSVDDTAGNDVSLTAIMAELKKPTEPTA